MENCLFLNNKKFKILTLLNVERKEFYNTVNFSNFIFNNFTVVNNLGNHVNQGIRSLFSFYSPLKPINITFNDCLFENNVIGKTKTVSSYLFLKRNKFYSYRRELSNKYLNSKLCISKQLCVSIRCGAEFLQYESKSKSFTPLQ